MICTTQITTASPIHQMTSHSELSDVATAVADGVDCFVLSRETSMGKYSAESIGTLSLVCKEAEAAGYQRQIFSNVSRSSVPLEAIYAIAIAAVQASMKCNAAVILVTTVTGRSARILSRYRPRCPIVAITRYGQVARILTLWRGVIPLHYTSEWKISLWLWRRSNSFLTWYFHVVWIALRVVLEKRSSKGTKIVRTFVSEKPLSSWVEDIDKRMQFGIDYGKSSGFITGGDAMVIVSGSKTGAGFTNTVKIAYASEIGCYHWKPM